MKLPRTHKIILLIAAVLFAVAVVIGLSGCTKRDEAAARAAGAAAGTIFGLPPVVGDSLIGLVLLVSHAVAAKVGHRRGRRCQIPHPLVPKAPTP